MGSILIGAFAGFIVTLLLGVPIGLLLPFVGVLIGMLVGGFVAGVQGGLRTVADRHIPCCCCRSRREHDA